MKDPSDRTKVVVRYLPPSISQAVLMDQIDGRFAGRYDWVCFRPGKNSQKHQRHSRAYLNFKKPEDVVEFAEFFDGHLFVNEKGAQFKALVEYSPSQRLPKLWSKKDGREGTISTDQEYLEFLELISKPVEHLPSAEIQLERKEAERAGSTKEALLVTPLMDFVRKKRAAKGGPQRLTSSGKASRRASGISAVGSSSSKRSSERHKVTYVLRDTTKKGSAKDKPTFILMSRREKQQSYADKSVSMASLTRKESLADEHAFESGKSRRVLLKGKEKEGSDASRVLVQQQVNMYPVRNSPTTSRHNQASGRIIRSLLSKEGHMDQSYVAASQTEQQMQAANAEKEKRLAWPPNAGSNMKDSISRSSSSLVSISDGDDNRYFDDKVAINNTHGFLPNSEKHENRTRNKDRPDRGVWAPLRRSDKAQPSDGTPSSNASQMLTDASVFISQKAGAKIGEEDRVVQNARTTRGSNSHASFSGRIEETRSHGGRVNLFAVENGTHRHVGRRGLARGLKEVDNSMSFSEGKSAKRGPTGYSSHERQVWVQKSGSAS